MFAAVAALASSAIAIKKNQFSHLKRMVPPVDPDDPGLVTIVGLNDAMGSGFFDQLLDHNDPSKGTFQQKFWWNHEFWGGPGSPVSCYAFVGV